MKIIIQKKFNHLKRLRFIPILFIFVICLSRSGYCFEIKTSYTSIFGDDKTLLEKFDDKLYMGKLRYYMPKNLKSIEERLAAKIDLITHRAQSVLEMYPKNLKFEIYILKDTKAVRDAYYKIYQKESSFIAFYSPKMNAVFVSVEKLKLRILAHEIGHVIVENYFEISPPVKIHEVLAQFTERNLGN